MFGRRTLWAAAAALLLSGSPAARALTLDDVSTVLPTAVDAYRYLHRNPELGKAELKAHAYLTAQLQAIGGFAFIPSVKVPTAVLAVLDTGRPGPVIALRAEMDARKLDAGASEPAHHDPRSEVDGLMHNCGHDVHAAILLATARFVAEHPERFAGKLVFLFQPAEETAGGADDIVEEKLLDSLGVTKIFALHAAPGIPVGTVSVSSGASLAGSNYFTLTLKGRGSHAAAPFEGDDLPLVASHFVQALTQLPARRLDIANRPVVVSVTRLKAESGGLNILPEGAEIAGTIRAFEGLNTPPPGELAIASVLSETVDRLAKAYNVTADWDLRPASPPTRNDEALFADLVPRLRQAWPGTVDTRPWRGMFSEDFAYYTASRPALYFSLGVAKGGLGEAGVHTAAFTVHPDAFEVGIRLMSLIARLATSTDLR